MSESGWITKNSSIVLYFRYVSDTLISEACCTHLFYITMVLFFTDIGIQTGCETVLLQLANASCGGEKVPSHIPKWKAGHVKNKMKLHAAHVLTMDALLAVGLELGSHAPKCWKHVFRYDIVSVALLAIKLSLV